LPEEVAKTISHAEVNGAVSEVKHAPDGTIFMTGLSEAGKPLRWAIR
jgi:hypothetical protein